MSFPVSSIQNHDYLLMLADVAAGDNDPPSPPSDHESFENLHIPSNSPLIKSMVTRPLRRSNTSNSLHQPKITLKGSRKLAKVLELPRSQAIAREDKIRRQRKIKAVIDQAQKIKSVGNSPVNPSQLRLLQSVFYNITKFPSEYWTAIMAVLIRRNFSQVKTWFSNQRQHVRAEQIKRKLPPDPVISASTVEGVTVKFREEGMKLIAGWQWSDDLFEGAVNLQYFRR